MVARTICQRVENLEPRFLLAANFASLSAAGTLSVTGTSASNVIEVAYSGTTVKATLDGASLVFDKTKVKRIWAEGFGGNDKITNGVALPSTLIGDAGNDTLVGNTKGDSLVGGSGDDRFMAGTNESDAWDKINFINPGSGNDVIDYSNEPAGTFSLGYQYIINHSVGGKDYSDVYIDPSAGESHLTIQLTPGNDMFGATGTETNWIVNGGAGNDFLWLVQASVYAFNGGAGNDTIDFNYDDGIWSVSGGSGNDIINDESGYGGPITCDGGSGYDTYNLTPDIPAMEAPIYDVTVPAGIEAFNTAVERGLVIHGNSLDNKITGVASNVTIYGNGGNDWIDVEPHLGVASVADSGHGLAAGGSGNDTLIGALATVFEGDGGTDTADFSSRTTNLSLSLDNKPNDGAAGENANILSDVENLIGGSGNDKLVGNPFNNVLKGGAGNDTIYGGAGNDTLDGGAGRDMLFGQDGDDLLLAKDGRTDTLDGGNGFDKAQRDNSATIKDQVLNIEAFI
jgi:Ca2+-binding RTX toxin-like protein